MLISVEQIAISKTSRRNVFSTLKQHNQRETAFLPKQQNVVCSSYMSHMLNKYQLAKTICSQQQIVSAQVRFSACFSAFFFCLCHSEWKQATSNDLCYWKQKYEETRKSFGQQLQLRWKFFVAVSPRQLRAKYCDAIIEKTRVNIISNGNHRFCTGLHCVGCYSTKQRFTSKVIRKLQYAIYCSIITFGQPIHCNRRFRDTAWLHCFKLQKHSTLYP